VFPQDSAASSPMMCMSYLPGHRACFGDARLVGASPGTFAGTIKDQKLSIH
jgi:hypothetical protein